MLVNRAELAGLVRLTVILLLPWLQHRRGQKRHLLVEEGVMAGDGDVMAYDEGQEQEIVRDACADALAGRRVPPVLHVAFLELPARRPQDLRPRLLRRAVDEGHHVLQLIAETVGAAGLVERGAAPDAAA